MAEGYRESGTVVAVCTSDRKGQKKATGAITLVRGHGIAGDFHAGTWHRQVSLLEKEKIDGMREKGLDLDDGAFGENIITHGIDLHGLAMGRRLRVGEDAVVRLTQRGKECHVRCPIYYAAGECIMPTEGIFARVVRGGSLRAGDRIAADPALDALRFAVLTLSDKGSRGERVDSSGPLAVELLQKALGGHLVVLEVLPDDREAIERRLAQLADDEICDLVVTTGGTGLSPRDVTPEATMAVGDRVIPGMAEAMRAEGLRHTPHAMLSRAVCVQRGHAIIVNLSGSPKAVREQLDVLLPALPHAIATAAGIPADCGR